jgi:hypothetical protein
MSITALPDTLVGDFTMTIAGRPVTISETADVYNPPPGA